MTIRQKLNKVFAQISGSF